MSRLHRIAATADKFSLKTLLIVLVVLLIPIVLLIRLGQKAGNVSAAWFNDSWQYRQAINISSHTALESNVYIGTTITISATSKAKSDDTDFRFTTANGQLLSYYLVSGVGTTTISFHIQFSSFPAGAQTVYAYYGNPSAASGASSSDFATQATNYTIGSLSSEETGGGPVAWWKFDEGYGSTAYDSTSNQNNAVFGTGSSAPSWVSEDQCVTGKCLQFNGTTDYAKSTSNVLVNNDFTVELWFKTGLSQTKVLAGNRGGGVVNSGFTIYLNSNNTIVATYGNGTSTATNINPSYTYADNNWHHLVFQVQRTSQQLNTLYIDNIIIASNSGTVSGTVGSANVVGFGAYNDASFPFQGYLDDVKIYPYARTASQIAQDYNAGKAHASTANGVAVNMGSNNKNSDALSNGLVGYWKFDENTGTTTLDSSGNNNTAIFGSGSSAPAWTTGKYGVGLSFNAANKTILSTGYTGQLNDFTISLWFKDDGSAQSFERLADKNYGTGFWLGRNGSSANSWGGGIEEGSSPYGIYGTFPDNQWNHMVSIRRGTTHELYANGVLVASNNVSASPLDTTPLNFGNGPTSQALGGILDEVRLYNRALSPTEVSALYNWAPGPVHYWDLNDNSGTTVIDKAGSNNGNLGAGNSAPVWTIGKYGSALSFDGTKSNVVLNNNANSNLVIANNYRYTVSAWVKPAAISQTGAIYGEGAGPSTGGQFSGLRYVNGYFNINYNDHYGAGDNIINLSSGSTYPINNWYYVSLVRDTNNFSLFVNGISIGTTSYVWNNTWNYAMVSNGIGANIYWAVNSFFNGSIDDVRIYNYARTQKQIVEDMNAGHPVGGSPVGSQALYYKFDEGQGSVVYDFSPTKQNATISIGPSAPQTTVAQSRLNGINGKFNEGVSLDGIDDQIIIPYNSALNLPTDFSSSVWVYNRKPSGSSQPKILLAHEVYNTNGFRWWINVNNTVTFSTTQSGGNLSVTSNTVLDQNQWYYLAFTYSGTTGTLYINGIKEKSATGTYTPSTSYYYLGGITDNRYYYDAIIDEFKIYNSALTDSDIALDYNNGKSLVMGSLSSANTGNTAPSTSASQEYCVPGDSTSCAPPVARWDFQEGTGTTAYDTSGNSLNATWSGTGTHWTQGKVGTASLFNGSNDYLDAGTNPTFNQSTAVTLEAWIRSDGTQNWTSVLGKGFETTANYSFEANSNWIRLTTGNGSSYLGVVNYYPNVGQWYHYAGVFQSVGSSSTGTLYVNGVNQGTGNFNSWPLTASTANFGVGRAGGSGYFKGAIDQVRIYNYARTPAQIAWDYNRGKPIAWYKMDECQGTAIGDWSMNGNTATLSVGPSGSQNSVGTCSVGTSAAWTNGASGKFNSGISLDGNDDYITSNLSVGGSQGTIAFWVKNPAAGSGSYLLRSDSNTRTYFQISSSNIITIKGNPSVTIYNGIINPANWNHIALTWSPSGSSMLGQTYINGTAVGIGQTFTDGSKGTFLTIGGFWTNGTQNASGIFDDVRAYNYALTPEQIKQVYNNGSAVNYSQ